MPVYKVRQRAKSYGHAIGILLLDNIEPNIPGDVANASTFGYPVIFQTVTGLTVNAALTGNPECKEAVIEAARELENQGVKGISSNCGFLVHYQDVVTKVVEVPVFLSSLLQLPLIAKSLGQEKAIGIITASSKHLTDNLLAKTGIPPQIKVYVGDLWDMPEFHSALVDQRGTLDSAKLQEDTIVVANNLIEQYPQIGAILLECAVLPPYACAVQEATNLPIFDFITMIDYLYSITHQKYYHGEY